MNARKRGALEIRGACSAAQTILLKVDDFDLSEGKNVENTYHSSLSPKNVLTISAMGRHNSGAPYIGYGQKQ